MNNQQPTVPEYPHVPPEQAPNCGVPVASYLPTLAFLAERPTRAAIYGAEQTERLRPLESTGLIEIDAQGAVAITAAGLRFCLDNWTVPRD